MPEVNKWAYKPDNSGKYVHVHVPYDGKYKMIQLSREQHPNHFQPENLTTGGYGPFQNPYDHIVNPYAHLEK